MARLKLRAHHICCIPQWTKSTPGRSPKFYQVEDKIKRLLASSSDLIVEVAEGIDELCKECKFCVQDRCQSPEGDEDEVKKWDAILLRELNLSFGSALSAREWQVRVEEKIPFRLCRRCKWQSLCRAGSLLSE